MSALELVAAWREQARRYDADGVTVAARVLDRCSDELEAALGEADNPLLSPAEAAQRSGYHRESIARLLRSGKLRNYGTPRRPLVRALDLPKKAERPPLTLRRAAGIVGAQ